MAQQTDDDGCTELNYEDRQALREGEAATLVYDSPYSGTRVEKDVTVLDTSGSVTVELEDGTVWAIFGGGSIRTTVDTRRASGEVDAKNGRTVGYLVDLEQPRLMTDGAHTADNRTADLALTVAEDTLDAWQRLVARDLAEKHFGDRSNTGTFHHESTAIVDMHPVLGGLNALGLGDEPHSQPSPEAVEALAEDLAQMNQILGEAAAPLAEARELAERLDEGEDSPRLMTDGGEQKMDYDRVCGLIEDGVNTNQDITEALDSSVGHVGRVLKRWTEDGKLARQKNGHAYVYSVPDEDEQQAQQQATAATPAVTPGPQASRQQGGDALRAPVDRDYDWASFVPAEDEVPEYISHNGEKVEIELEIAAIQQWVNGVKKDLREELGEDPTPEQVTSECRRRENADGEYAPRLPRYMIDGPTGCGKTTLAEDLAAHPPKAARDAAEQYGWPVVEIQFTYDMSPAELLGSPQLVGGSTVWEDGGLTKALLASREGPVVVILDEVPRARPEVHSTLMDALDHRARVKLTGRGHEEIQGIPHNLITVATANLGDEYQHFEMDPAHKRRLGDRHSVDYLGRNYPHREADLVAERTGCPSRLADLLVETANQVRDRADDATSDVRFGVPTAALIDWAQKARSLAAYDVEGMDGVENPVVQAAMGTVVRRWYDGNQAEADTVRQIVKDNLDGCPYAEDDVAAWAGDQEYVVCSECEYQAPVNEAEKEGVLDFMECPDCSHHVERKTSAEMQDEDLL